MSWGARGRELARGVLSDPGHSISVGLLLGSVVLGAWTLLDPAIMRACFVHGSYYLVAASVAVWCAVAARTARRQREAIRAYFVANKIGLLAAFVLALALTLSVESTFRVLADETNLAAVSKAMTFEKRVDNVTEGYWYYDNFYPQVRELEKRPLLMPFLTHLVHVVSGYRPANAFVVNFLALLTILGLVYGWAAKHWGVTWGLVALLFTSSQPLLSQVTNSGGLEPVNTACFLLSLAALGWFLAAPGADRLLVLWANLLLLLHTRYEAIAVVGVVAALLLAFGQLRLQALREHSCWYAATPLLLLPVLWQRLLLLHDPLYPEASLAKVFSARHLVEHNTIYWRHLVDFSRALPYATLVDILGLAGILLFVALFLTKRIAAEPEQRRLGWIVMASVLALWIVLTSFFLGRLDHPSQSRLFLPFPVLWSLAATWLLQRVSWLRARAAVPLLIAASCVLLYLPISIENRFSNQLLLVREYRFALEFLSEQPRQALFISDRPGMYTAHDYGAISFGRANADPSQVLLARERHLLADIFVIQKIEYATEQPAPGYALHPAYSLETLREQQNEADSYLRISRVAKRPAPAATRPGT